MDLNFQEIKFDEKGLLPAVIQEAGSARVLMVGYMNQEALTQTVKKGQVHFFSRKRNTIWRKGETSGHFQKVKKISLDCDGDTLLIEVTQEGSACHKGYHSCFYRVLADDGSWQVVEKKEFEPKNEDSWKKTYLKN